MEAVRDWWSIRRFARWRVTRILWGRRSTYATIHMRVAGAAKPVVREWEGLLGYVVIVQPDAQGELLLAYWEAREDFDRQAQRFTNAAGPLSLEGYASDPREPWLTRMNRVVPYTTVLLTFVAILTAFQSLGTFWDLTFLDPSLQFTTQRPALLYTAGQPITEMIEIANRTTTPHRDVTIEFARIEDDNGRTIEKLALSNASFGTFPSNTSEPVQLLGTAPQVPGSYKLHLRSAATAGWSRGHKERDFTPQIVVWDPRDLADPLHPVEISPAKISLRSNLRIGRAAPNGLTCECALILHPNVRMWARYPGMSEPRELPSSTAPGKEVTTIEWHAPKSDGLERIQFGIELAGQNLDPNIANFLKVRCHANP